MRKLAIVLVASIALTTAVGCGGPFYVSGVVSDWYAQQYGESPWLFGNIISAGIYGWVYYIVLAVDGIFVNTYYFWFKDAQPFGDGKGTVFEHKAPSSGKKMK
ncbi:MAG TPA: hypothetical protein VFC90_11220 [Planctomycetota bacterium]|nr:hypothetical protein [Planctomycetota bacterium]